MTDRTELAEDRTDWAEDRTLLANERTFAAWVRTALASAAIGIGLQALFRAAEPTWLAKTVATIFLVIAIVVLHSGLRGACATLDRLAAHDSAPTSGRRLRAITWIMSLAIALTAAVLWLI